jgi:hypothetical protein
VLLLFLPPLIYYAGFYSDPRETVEHLPAVIGQSVGLVLVTAGTCAGALLLVFPDVWAGRRRSRSAPRSPRRTRWPRRTSCSDSACHAGW